MNSPDVILTEKMGLIKSLRGGGGFRPLAHSLIQRAEDR